MLTSLRQQLPEAVRTALSKAAAFSSAAESLQDPQPHRLLGHFPSQITPENLIALFLPLLILLFSMSWAKGYWDGRYSPFTGGAAARGPPSVTDDDYHYIGPDDIVDPPQAASHNESYGFPRHHVSRTESTDSSIPDVLVLRHKGQTYPLQFAAFTIADGNISVGDLRRMAGRELKTDDYHRIRLLYKGRKLNDDDISCKDEGLKQNSEIMCVVGESSQNSKVKHHRGRHTASNSSSSASEEEMLDNGIASGLRINVDGSIIEEEDDRRRRRKNHRGGQKPRTARDSSPPLSSVSASTTSTLVPPSSSHRGVSPGRSPSRARSPTVPSSSTPPSGPAGQLEALATKFREEFQPQCQNFIASPPADTKTRDNEYKKLTETILAQIILKLDEVTTGGEDSLRARRKALVKETQSWLTDLDKVVGKKVDR